LRSKEALTACCTLSKIARPKRQWYCFYKQRAGNKGHKCKRIYPMTRKARICKLTWSWEYFADVTGSQLGAIFVTFIWWYLWQPIWISWKKDLTCLNQIYHLNKYAGTLQNGWLCRHTYHLVHESGLETSKLSSSVYKPARHTQLVQPIPQPWCSLPL
jgi:hypothetical protein